MSTGDRIAELAKSCLGKPYRHRGHGPDEFDCLGLLIHIAKTMNYEVPFVPPYSKNPSGHTMKRYFEAHAEPVNISSARKGDFLHMAWSRQPQHVAIVIGTDPLTICHADSQLCMVVKHILTPVWRGRIRAAYRLPEPVSLAVN